MQGEKDSPVCVGGRGEESDTSRVAQRSYGTINLGRIQGLPGLGSWATWFSLEVESDFAAGPVLGRWLDQTTSRRPFLPKSFCDISICAVLFDVGVFGDCEGDTDLLVALIH